MKKVLTLLLTCTLGLTTIGCGDKKPAAPADGGGTPPPNTNPPAENPATP